MKKGVLDNKILEKGGCPTDIAEMITEELNCETVFTIPVFGGIPVGESTVVTWIIMAALTIISILLVRNLKVENPGKKQLALEAGIGFLQDFFTDILGERGKRYVPYLITGGHLYRRGKLNWASWI